MIMNAFLPAVQMQSSQEVGLVERTLTEYSNSDITKVGSRAFYGYSTLTSIEFQNCSLVSYQAFCLCSALQTVSLPNCLVVDNGAFSSCSALTNIYIPKCTSLGNETFHSCPVVSLDLPELTGTDVSTFAFCSFLTSISVPKLTGNPGQYTFNCCYALPSIVLPKVSSLGSSIFRSCRALSAVYLLNNTTASIYNYAFQNCYNLLSLYLLGTSIRRLANANAFYSTPISTYTTSTGGVQGSIYVPSSLYATYSKSTNWATYAARFVSLTDAQISAIKESLGL